MAGEPVTDEHTIPVELAPPLQQLAQACIDGSEAMIAQLYPENPQTVYDTLYRVGYESCLMIDALNPVVDINLN